jgi:hypothetical protein
VPSQAGEMDEQHIQRENANVARDTQRQHEVDVVVAVVGQPSGNIVPGAGEQPACNVINRGPPLGSDCPSAAAESRRASSTPPTC